MTAAERQQQLLEVAMSVFSRRGFKGATTKEIAAEAGVTEGVVFQHFPSKEALYSAVLELHLKAGDEDRWIKEISRLMERNDDEGVFLSFISRILFSYRNDPMIERVILFAALEGHEQGLARMHKQFAPVFEIFMEYIIRRQQEGALANCNPYAIMIALGGVAQLFTRILLRGAQEHQEASPVPSVKAGSKNKNAATQSNRKAKK
jgi:TetR/AcrR family transcriptional regulator